MIREMPGVLAGGLHCWGCCSWTSPGGRPGYIGSADEQAYQFLQERRMDGDVKIPIWNAFFWAYWNILWYYKASLKTSLISSFSPNTQSSMQNSTLKKKRKNWVLISIYYFKVLWTEEVVWLSRDDFFVHNLHRFLWAGRAAPQTCNQAPCVAVYIANMGLVDRVILDELYTCLSKKKTHQTCNQAPCVAECI